LKIALCIPCHRQTEAKFTHCLAAMIAYTMSQQVLYKGELVTPEIETFIVSCSLLTETRNRLVVEAINWEADYMLWMDADHIFPRDALLNLLCHGKLVVGCNYARRAEPTAPTASILNAEGKKELVWTTKAKAQAQEVEEVAHVGLGLCLVDMRVYGVLEQQAVNEGKEHFWPLFRIDPTEDGIASIGEDVLYFQKLRDAGIPVHCDHGLSWHVGHLHEMILTNAHCEAQQDRWKAHQKTKFDKFKKAEAVE
jgi:hypothetical protein